VSVDWDMQLALEEVDRLTPEAPPIAPPRPASRSLVGAFVRGLYVVEVLERECSCRLSNGAFVPKEWVEDNITSGARV
jgi:hypothetical protein